VFDTALIGPPDDVIAALVELRATGVDLTTLRFWFDVTAGPDAWASMALFAREALTASGTLR
jgi:hypothetical protein